MPEHHPHSDALLIDHAHHSGHFSMDTRHQHARFEIYYLRNGERNYFIRDRVWRVQSGDIVLIPAHELHKTSACGPTGHERFLIEFAADYLRPFLDAAESPDLLEPFFRNQPLLHPGPEIRVRIEQLFAALVEEYRGSGTGRDTAIRAMIMEMLVLLGRCLQTGQSGTDNHPEHLHRTISAITSHLNTHYAQAIGLADVARRFAISPSYLSRVFVRVTGMHFAAYLTAIRLREARRLLSETREPVSQVAARCGFASATSFGRAFRQASGLTPLQYRSLHAARAG